MKMRIKPALPALAVLVLTVCSQAQPIRQHPSNPHYFLFRNQPTVLITSAEHYGAVINKDFDYAVYLDALRSYGFNYTRIYPGALFEPVGKFIKGNPLGPKPASLIVPWARSTVPGYNLGGNQFDLDRWDAEYFARLRDFIAKAGEHGIVVEICFFNAQYSDTWPISPLYHENNIQHEGNCDYQDAQTLKHPDLVKRQEDYVRKIYRASELVRQRHSGNLRRSPRHRQTTDTVGGSRYVGAPSRGAGEEDGKRSAREAHDRRAGGRPCRRAAGSFGRGCCIADRYAVRMAGRTPDGRHAGPGPGVWAQ
jgi:hypothetical protein